MNAEDAADEGVENLVSYLQRFIFKGAHQQKIVSGNASIERAVKDASKLLETYQAALQRKKRQTRDRLKKLETNIKSLTEKNKEQAMLKLSHLGRSLASMIPQQDSVATRAAQGAKAGQEAFRNAWGKQSEAVGWLVGAGLGAWAGHEEEKRRERQLLSEMATVPGGVFSPHGAAEAKDKMKELQKDKTNISEQRMLLEDRIQEVKSDKERLKRLKQSIRG